MGWQLEPLPQVYAAVVLQLLVVQGKCNTATTRVHHHPGQLLCRRYDYRKITVTVGGRFFLNDDRHSVVVAALRLVPTWSRR
jgi:hypothetical protein